MKCQIFISYRRDDSGDAAKWLFEALKKKFGSSHVFMDTESILGGEKWDQKIKNKLKEAEIVLILIGKTWLTTGSNEFGIRRIDNKNDWVRREIEISLEHNKQLIPILLNGATMPPEEALPKSIQILRF